MSMDLKGLLGAEERVAHLRRKASAARKKRRELEASGDVPARRILRVATVAGCCEAEAEALEAEALRTAAQLRRVLAWADELGAAAVPDRDSS